MPRRTSAFGEKNSTHVLESYGSRRNRGEEWCIEDLFPQRQKSIYTLQLGSPDVRHLYLSFAAGSTAECIFLVSCFWTHDIFVLRFSMKPGQCRRETDMESKAVKFDQLRLGSHKQNLSSTSFLQTPGESHVMQISCHSFRKTTTHMRCCSYHFVGAKPCAV
jgi:hypothetical protein